MKRTGKLKKCLKWVIIALLILVIGTAIGFKIYTSHYYKADMITINALRNKYANSIHAYSSDEGMVFIPQEQPKAVIVFYPGGKVEYTAYSSLMYELASRGYVCLLPKMPENLAFLRINAAEKLISGHDEQSEITNGLNWYLAGHSLGGVAAASYLKDEDIYSGLILCASYTTVDYSDSDIRLLSIYGDSDGIMNRESYEESKAFWPKDSTEYVIKGGTHAYFGSYGFQVGDGLPGISNVQQIEKTADIISKWIK